MQQVYESDTLLGKALLVLVPLSGHREHNVQQVYESDTLLGKAFLVPSASLGGSEFEYQIWFLFLIHSSQGIRYDLLRKTTFDGRQPLTEKNF